MKCLVSTNKKVFFNDGFVSALLVGFVGVSAIVGFRWCLSGSVDAAAGVARKPHLYLKCYRAKVASSLEHWTFSQNTLRSCNCT